MANKVALKMVRDTSGAAQYLICAAAEPNMADRLTEFLLGLLSEEESAKLVAHSLGCAACLSRFYQLRTSLRSIRYQLTVSDEPVEDIERIDLFAEFERCADEEIPDIPTTEQAEYYQGVESAYVSDGTTSEISLGGVSSGVENQGVGERQRRLNGFKKPKCLAAPAV